MAEAAAGDGPGPRIPKKTFSPKLFVVLKNFLGIKNGFKRLLWVQKFLGNFLLFNSILRFDSERIIL